MKKAEEYLKELFEEPFELEKDSIEKDFYSIIKRAQEDVIKETVRECAEMAIHYTMFDKEPVAFKSSIISVADKLIKKLW